MVHGWWLLNDLSLHIYNSRLETSVRFVWQKWFDEVRDPFICWFHDNYENIAIQRQLNHLKSETELQRLNALMHMNIASESPLTISNYLQQNKLFLQIT